MSTAYELPRLPTIYLIEDHAINSFVTGRCEDEIVIGVTRGAFALPLAQVQGMIAHQFFFVLYGDMRLNSRLFKYSGGISAFAMLASLMVSCRMQAGGEVEPGDGRQGAEGEAWMLETPHSAPPPPPSFLLSGGLELFLFCIGLLGWFVNRLLQAALLRTCRLAADAHAVQFTGDPQGYLDLLDSIRCGSSQLRSPFLLRHCEHLSWLFFADVRPSPRQPKSGRQNRWASLMEALCSPHPPLVQRLRNICKLLPEHESSTPSAAASTRQGGPHRAAAAATGTAGEGGERDAGAAGAATDTAPEAADAGIPQPLRTAAGDPTLVRAVALLPLLAYDREQREEQFALLDPTLAEQMRNLWPHWRGLDPDRDLWRLLKLVAPRLKAASPLQRSALWSAACSLVSADKALTISEFIVLRSLERLLEERRPATPSPLPLPACRDELAIFFAHAASAAGSRIAPQVYQDAWRRIAPKGPEPPAPPVPDGYALGRALDRMHALDGANKRAVLAAIVRAVTARGGAVRPLAANLIILLAREFGLPEPALAIDTACILDD